MDAKLTMMTEEYNGFVSYCFEGSKWSSQKVKKDKKGDHIIVKGVKHYIPDLSGFKYEVVDGIKYYTIQDNQ